MIDSYFLCKFESDQATRPILKSFHRENQTIYCLLFARKRKKKQKKTLTNLSGNFALNIILPISFKRMVNIHYIKTSLINQKGVVWRLIKCHRYRIYTFRSVIALFTNISTQCFI